MTWMKKYIESQTDDDMFATGEAGYCPDCRKVVELGALDDCSECGGEVLDEYHQAYCEDCEEEVYINVGEGHPVCDMCSSEDIYMHDVKTNAKCTSCMEEWIENRPSGDCRYCGAKKTVAYGTDEELANVGGPETRREVWAG